MGFHDCLKTLADAGDITREEAETLAARYDHLARQKGKDVPGFAAQAARETLVKQLEAEKGHKRLQLALTVKRLKALDAVLATSKKDMPDTALDLLEHFGGQDFVSVEGLKNAIVGRAHGQMEALLYEFRRTKIRGARGNRAGLDNVVMEAFGENSGDLAAKGLAETWAKTHEWLRQRFNAAGGAIAKLEKWGLPQSHNPDALRAAGRETWKARIRPLLAPERMTHPLSGDPVTPEEMDALLDHVYASATTDGWAFREPSMAAFGRGALGNQHAEHRVLIFRDARSWLSYQTLFGEGDPFSAMMGHVNRMARDIAAMEVLGPNPNAMLEWLKQAVTKSAAGGDVKATDKASRAVHRLDQIWAAQRGALNTPVNTRAANVLAAGRSFITSSIMGGATIIAVQTDINFSALARGVAGLPVHKTGQDIIKQFNPKNRREAVAAGLILETAMHTFHQQARYVGTLGGGEWARWLADRTLTWSGLTPWTQAARHAGGLAFMEELGSRATQSFDALPPALQRTLKNWGNGPDVWDQWRAAGTHEARDGVRLLRPTEMAKVNEGMADRYLAMINGEVEYMVPQGSVRNRSWLTTERPGTIWGEISRTGTQLKSFATLFMFLHASKIAQLGGWTSATGAAYAGSVLISATLAGGLAMQLQSVAQGRDPQTMLDAKFWGAAMLKGGGLGLFGDFFFADMNRYGGGFGRTMQGPGSQAMWDFWTLTGGNVGELLTDGSPKNAGRELVDFIKSNTPGGSIWYARLGYERLVLDQLQHLADPEANKAFKRKQQFWAKTRGQDFYWRPGQTLPDRAPDLGAAVGQ